MLDKDFPALAPASVLKTSAAIAKPVVVPTTGKKKERERQKGKAKVEEKSHDVICPPKAMSSNSLVDTPLAGELHMQLGDHLRDVSTKETMKGAKPEKPILPPVDTSAPSKEKGSEKGGTSAIDGSIMSVPVSATSSTPQLQKHAPQMIRVLSKGSDISSGSVKTQATSGKPSALAFESATEDTASQASSRPVSPPHRVIGSSLLDMPAVKVKSKSAIKKERRAADKARAETESTEAASVLGENHAPIPARMKKKERKAKWGGDAPSLHDGATDSGRQTPVPSPVPEDIDPFVKEGPGSSSHTESRDPILYQQPQQQRQPKLSQLKQSEQAQPTENQYSSTENLTTAQIIQQIKDIDFTKLDMLKLPISGLRTEHLTPEELHKLRSAQLAVEPPSNTPDEAVVRLEKSGIEAGSVHLSLRGGGTIETRMLVTPQGAVLRGLSEEQENRFLEMEARRALGNLAERWCGSGNYHTHEPSLKAAVTAHTVAAGLAAAGSVARSMHLGADEASRLSTKEALDYLWHTVIPALPGYGSEQLEGLAQSIANGGCRVSVGLGEEPKIGEQCVTVDFQVEGASPGNGLAKKDVTELERLVVISRKETETLEKKVEKLVKRNRKIVGLV